MSYKVIVDSCGELTAEMKASVGLRQHHWDWRLEIVI